TFNKLGIIGVCAKNGSVMLSLSKHRAVGLRILPPSTRPFDRLRVTGVYALTLTLNKLVKSRVCTKNGSVMLSLSKHRAVGLRILPTSPRSFDKLMVTGVYALTLTLTNSIYWPFRKNGSVMLSLSKHIAFVSTNPST